MTEVTNAPNYVPIDPKNGSKTQSKTSFLTSKKAILGVILFFLVTIPAGIIINNQLQSSQGDAVGGGIACGPCVSPPPGPYNKCIAAGGPAPAPGECKPKGNPEGSNTCWECRRDDNQQLTFWRCNQIGTGGRWVEGCGEQPSPTQPPIDKPTETPPPTRTVPTITTPPEEPTKSPSPTQACILPVVNVEVECLQCSGQ